jgi:sugar lactone lactonase YvrE
MWVKKISIGWADFTRRFARSRKAITSTVSALLISITALFSSSSHAQVNVAGVQTEIPATGISYAGSSCSTSTTGLWCGPVGIATDSRGNIYVANFSASQIIKLDAATHTPTVLLGYGSGTTGVGHPQQVAMDSSDNLFIADPDNSRVVKYSTTTNAVTASYPIAIYPFAVGVDSSGNAWIGGSGDIYEVPAGSANGTSATLKMNAAATGTSNIWGIAFDSNGDMWVSDNPNNNRPGVNSGSVTRFTAASSFSSKTVVLTSSTLYGPGQIVFDTSNNMYLAEDNNNSVVKFNYSSGYAFGYIASDSYPVSQSVPSAEAVARDSSGNLFLTAYASGVQANSKVVEISPGAATFPDTLVGSTSSTNVTVNFNVVSGTTIGSFAVLDQGVSGLEFNRVTDASADCTTGTYSSATACSIKASFTPSSPGIHYGAIVVLDGSGTVLAKVYLSGKGLGPLAAFLPGTPSTVGSGLNGPQGVYADGAGNVYIANTSGNSVIKVPFSGGAYGTPITITTDTGDPGGVAVDGAGNVYVADYDNNRIDLIPWNGNSYGTQIPVGSGFSSPNSVAVDGSGNVYVADEGNARIVKIPWNAGTATFGTQSAIGSSWNSPTGVAVDAAGNVYVAEYYDGMVYQLPVSGTSYGSVVAIGSGWSHPFNISVDSNGDVYVADSGTDEVSMVAWNGSSFGTQTVVASSTATGLYGATGVSVDGLGNIYIADQGNNRIVKLSDSTGAALTFPTSTAVGSLDSIDGTKTVTMLNLGNTTLNIASASFPTSFSESNSTCTLSSGTLSRGESCTIGVQFTPQSGGTNSGNLVITDNHLNVTGSTQNVALRGTGIATLTQLAYITAPAATVTAGGNAGTSITVAEENASGTTVTSATDTITITVTGPSSYSQTYSATAVSGVATFNLSSVPLTAAGDYVYTASITASPSITTAVANETVPAAAASTITGTGSATSLQNVAIGTGYSYPFSVSVVDQYGNPVQGATVSYSVPSSGANAVLSASTATTNASGAASVTGSANGLVGSFSITAAVAGVSPSATFPVANLKGDTTTVLIPTPASAITYGSTKTTLSGIVSPVTAGVTTTPTGTVTFYNSGTAMGAPVALSSGTAPLQLYLPAGTYSSLVAIYQGDANFNTSTSANASHTVNKAPVTLTAASSQTVQALSSNSTLSLTITGANAGAGILVPGSAGSSTLSCSFYNGGTLVASGAATVIAGSGASTADCPVPSTVTTTAGSYSATAAFNGDANYLSSAAGSSGSNGTSLNFSFTVQKLTPTITWAPAPSATNVVYGTQLVNTLTASASSSGSSVAGTWAYTATKGGSTVSVGSGTMLQAGSYTLTATFTPTNTSAYSTNSTTLAYVVTQATPGITVATSASPVWIGAAVTYTATVSGAAGGLAPTGTITFYDGATALGTGTLNASGQASITSAPTTTGTHSIKAIVAAENNYVTATSASLSEVAVDFTVAVASSGSSSVSVLPGATATYSLVLTPVGNTSFPGAITLSVSGLPAGTTATFTPASIASGAATTNLTLTLATSATTLVMNHVQSVGGKMAPLALALLFLPLVGFRRARKLWMRSLMVLALLAGSLAATVGMTGCALPSGYFGQTPKTFTVTVTANNGSFTHSTNVTLTVE